MTTIERVRTRVANYIEGRSGARGSGYYLARDLLAIIDSAEPEPHAPVVTRQVVLDELASHQPQSSEGELWACRCGFVGRVGVDLIREHQTDAILALLNGGSDE